MRILLVDDSRAFANSLRRALQRIEPDWQIDWVSTPEDAVRAASAIAYDVVAIDWNLKNPSMSGLDVLKEIRSLDSTRALVMLTVREEPTDRITAAQAGADDHIVKQLGLNEIRARLQVAATRGAISSRSRRCGPLQFDPDGQAITIGGKPLELSKHQARLLARLARQGGDAVDPSELCRTAGIEPGSGYKNLTNEVHRLRHRLEEHEPGAGELVIAVRGVGYALRDSSGKRMKR